MKVRNCPLCPVNGTGKCPVNRKGPYPVERTAIKDTRPVDGTELRADGSQKPRNRNSNVVDWTDREWDNTVPSTAEDIP